MMSNEDRSDIEKGIDEALVLSGSRRDDETFDPFEKLSDQAKEEVRRECAKMAADPNLEAWRRLAVYELLLTRRLRYPLEKEVFLREAISSVGLDPAKAVDMTRASALPFPTEPGDRVWMLDSGIPTSVGSAGVYFAENSNGLVSRAAVYPTGRELP